MSRAPLPEDHPLFQATQGLESVRRRRSYSRSRSPRRRRSRDRDRRRSRSRSRSHSRDRGRRRSRSRDRNGQSWSRGHDVSELAESSSRRRSRFEPLPSHQPDSEAPRHDQYSHQDRRHHDRGSRTSRRGDNSHQRAAPDWGTPSNSVIIRGLDFSIPEGSIKNAVVKMSRDASDVQHVRLILDHNTMQSRGFAFVDFCDVDAATAFLTRATGKLRINNCTPSIEYSHRSHSSHTPRTDWLCAQCSMHNFSKRDTCFRCHSPRTEECTSLTPEEAAASLKRQQNSQQSHAPLALEPTSLIVTGLAPASTEQSIRAAFEEICRVVSVNLNAERKCATVEFPNVFVATKALEGSVGLLIDGTPVRTEYVDPSAAHKALSGNAKRKRGKQPTTVDPSKRPAYLAPGFKYNANTERFFDEESGFLFDPTTHLFFHPKTEQHYRWNAAGKQYMLVDSRGVPIRGPIAADKKRKAASSIDAGVTTQTKQSTPEKQQEEDKSVKAKPVVTKPTALGSGPIKFTILGKKSNVDLQRWNKRQLEIKKNPIQASDLKKLTKNQIKKQKREERKKAEAKQANHIDWEKKICYLCKRKFKTVEMLKRHEKESDFHKKNLQVLQFKKMADKQRKKESIPPPPIAVEGGRLLVKPPTNKPVDESPGQSAEAKPLDESNIGFKLLQKSGWKKGEGLGKSGEGRVDPVEAVVVTGSAGLGSEPLSGDYAIKPGDSNSTIARKRARARYERGLAYDLTAATGAEESMKEE